MQSVIALAQHQQRLRAAASLTQVRWITLTFKRMEEAMQHLRSNPFYDKYAAKIDKLKQSHPSDLVEAVHARKAVASSEASDPVGAAAGVKRLSTAPSKPKTPLSRGGYAFAPQKKLESLLKLELLQNKSAADVAYVWTEYWRQQPVISGVMEADLYDAISATAAKYDKFVFAMPREQGYELVLAQFAAQEIHLTPLINYQAYQENAPECLTMVHYTELKDSLGVVLMKGEYDSKIISVQEAQFLANVVQLYYSGRDAAKLETLRMFHERPDQFSHMSVIRELEQLDLAAVSKQ